MFKTDYILNEIGNETLNSLSHTRTRDLSSAHIRSLSPAQLDMYVRPVNTELNQTRSRRDNAAREITNLQARKATLRREIANANSELTRMQKELDIVPNRIANAQTTVTSSDARIRDLTRALTEAIQASQARR